MQNGSSVKNAISVSNNTNDSITNAIIDKDYQIHNVNREYYQSNGDSVIVTTTPIHANHEHMMHENEIDPIEDQRNVERIARDWGVDSIDDVNAATAMLALKHGPKIFAETFQTG